MSPVLRLTHYAAMAVAALGAAALNVAAAAPAPQAHLAGNWAAEGIALRTLTTGAIVQGRCASGKITGAIPVDSRGRFGVEGYFNPQRSNLRLSNIGPSDTPASFFGVVAGNTLQLTIRRRGMPDQHYTLLRGTPASFARCNET